VPLTFAVDDLKALRGANFKAWLVQVVELDEDDTKRLLDGKVSGKTLAETEPAEELKGLLKECKLSPGAVQSICNAVGRLRGIGAGCCHFAQFTLSPLPFIALTPAHQPRPLLPQPQHLQPPKVGCSFFRLFVLVSPCPPI
jgi:hypothetical protein